MVVGPIALGRFGPNNAEAFEWVDTHMLKAAYMYIVSRRHRI